MEKVLAAWYFQINDVGVIINSSICSLKGMIAANSHYKVVISMMV